MTTREADAIGARRRRAIAALKTIARATDRIGFSSRARRGRSTDADDGRDGARRCDARGEDADDARGGGGARRAVRRRAEDAGTRERERGG